ncbi:hypothetical protein V5O48_014408 [Marasmius crinis-equi]|uniref:Transposase n=1 Tax=Marasmius crinis-equi TaxID=585013 RepID=A0ABR3EXD6_9AGAR
MDNTREATRVNKKLRKANHDSGSENQKEQPIKIDLLAEDGGKQIRKLFKKVMREYTLFEGKRVRKDNMKPITIFTTDDCERWKAWDRTFDFRISFALSTWKSDRREFMYFPGRLVFVDEQRAIAFTPRTQTNTDQRFSLVSAFDSLYGKEKELFVDNGYGQGTDIFYAGRYRCVKISGSHPAGFIHHTTELPWVLTRPVMDYQDPHFGLKLRPSDINSLMLSGEITFEFMGLQCVGFDMDLYHALSPHTAGSSNESSCDISDSELASPDVKSKKRSRTEAFPNDNHEQDRNKRGSQGRKSTGTFNHKAR